MSDENIITPIGAPREGKPGKDKSGKGKPDKGKPLAQPSLTPAKRSLRRDIDGLVALLAGLTALVTFGLAAYFFYGFTQTDQGFWTLASAFGLCFGVGALAYGPCFYLSRTAWHAVKGRATRKAFALALLLMLPWVCVALIFIGWSALPKLYGVLALILSVSFCSWAFKRMSSAPKI